MVTGAAPGRKGVFLDHVRTMVAKTCLVGIVDVVRVIFSQESFSYFGLGEDLLGAEYDPLLDPCVLLPQGGCQALPEACPRI